MAGFPTYEEMAENVAEKALDDFLYNGKSIREWMQIIASEDCISRQQAIDKMQELEDEDNEMYGCSIPEGFDGKRAIKALKTLPSVQPKLKTGWIPVSEGLPAFDEDVLVTNDRGIYVGWIDATDKIWRVDSESEYFMYDIVAWMPLPEPYKPTDSEKE